MRELRSAWRIPVALPATRWMAEIGAFAIRSDTELLLKSRRVVPSRLTDAGFTFNYPQWRIAATDLAIRRRRAGLSRQGQGTGRPPLP
jgi:NAD dependent epimerase/dehydratase family enzyme